ncbi:MAG: SIR2 family protein [Nitrospirales bacterium]|nr:SIR2 family protein [Nitrospirales bacterium]
MPTIPQELLDNFRNGKCGIFVGAGASIPSGLPDWNGLLKELVGKANSQPNIDKNMVKDFRKLLKDKSKHLMLASTLREELGAEFGKFIESRFNDDSCKSSKVHKLIAELSPTFVITTNYDSLIERAYTERSLGKNCPNVFTYKQAGDVASSLHRNKFFILKAHGDAKINPEDIILTEKDYRRILHHEPGYQSLMQTLFTTFTIFFIGSSFADIEVQLLLGFIHASFHGKTPVHYALQTAPEPNTALLKAWKNDFNIHSIHTRPDKNHKEVIQFLQTLKRKITPTVK